MANLGSQAGSGLDASDITTGTLGNTVQDNVTRLGTVTAGNLSHADIVYPAGHVTNVHTFTRTDATFNQTGAANKIAFTPIEFSAISGRKYVVSTSVMVAVHRSSETAVQLWQICGLYYGTTSRSQGAVVVGDTSLRYDIQVGRQEGEAYTSGYQFTLWSPTAHFTAGSTAPHYVYISCAQGDDGITARYFTDSDKPWTTTIYEVMP